MTSLRGTVGTLLLGLVLVACIPSPAATPAPEPSGLRGGVLRVGLGATPALDPLDAVDAERASVVRQVFEGLVTLEPGTFRVVPQLATAWALGADQRSWTFTLRGGVHFHDGDALDASAVAASLTRGGGGPGGLRASALGPLSVSITTATPYGPLLSELALPARSIVGRTPLVGTGPFALPSDAATRAGELTIAASPYAWQRDGRGRPLPLLNGIGYRVLAAAGARAAALRSGEIQLAEAIAPSDIALVRANPNLQLLWRPAAAVILLGFDLSRGPFSDVATRRAVALALDRKAMADRAPLPDATAPATQLLLPGLLGYDDSVLAFSRTDVDGAKRLLADARPAGITTELWTGAGTRAVSDAVAADLARAGVAVTVRNAPGASARGAGPLWIEERPLAQADPDALLGVLFGAGEESWSVGPALALLEAARAETDAPKRAELYKQVSKLVQQEIPRIPLLYVSSALAASRKVRGIVPSPLGAASLMRASLER
ncbi:MAG: ABC transporter substrate-binding protein [Chloroflexi bacterium]|nr:ABC transporter substrate-binding protein [Chloroflexota bacterium]